MKFKEQVISALAKATKLKKEQISELIEVPPDPKLGDLSLPCFKLSKQLKQDPKKIAANLAKKIKGAKATGPYINFFVDTQKLAEQVLKQISKEKNKYGSKKKTKKVILIESPSPNTNKPLHVGHLRNLALAISVSKILSAQGYDSKLINLINDRGVHISKSMLAYQNWGKNKKPNKKPDHFVGDYYVMFSQKAKQHPMLLDEAQQMLKEWEAGNKKIIALWKKMNDWAIKGHNETYKRLGVKHTKTYFESDMYEEGRKIVLEGLKKKLFYKKPDGAVAINLGGELGEKILIRKDGTTVYITQDLYLAQQKYKNFKYDKSVYVVGSEQDYHFKVLFKLLELLKLPSAKGCYHLSHGMVYLPSGRIKSREGTKVDADDLLDKLEAFAKKEVKARQKLPEKKLNELSRKIAGAALSYYFLKHNPKTDMLFVPKESISWEGDTGPYLQYALVRAKKIIKKIRAKKGNPKLLSQGYETDLIKHLALFPEVTEQAANQYSPHLVANYAKDLAAKFNMFYEKCSVIRAKSKELQKARLMLVSAFAQTLKNALDLLGIEDVELM